MSDWNANTIAEFRANEGRVGGYFEGAPVVLVHHRGRKSGREYVTPMMYLPHETDPDIIYVFATKSGAPTNPDWYYNLSAAGNGSVERGTETYKVIVRELKGVERDRVYAEQARRFPGYAEYPRRTAGVRTIPVLRARAGVRPHIKARQRVAFEQYTCDVDWPLTVDGRQAGVRRSGSGRLLAAGPYLLAASGTRALIAAAAVLSASLVLRAS